MDRCSHVSLAASFLTNSNAQIYLREKPKLHPWNTVVVQKVNDLLKVYDAAEF